ncbi:MAG TPA: chitobiase/beta-hexosaminidase C-terminal domain-containing protein, partial [Flavobacterium sp.]|uniref:chitobiase/beta-hexosaminidase C-terminal domain-containing protein n=1 Tax=Flavobacterium sp. TaxID=239 RepID=UPI002DBF8A47
VVLTANVNTSTIYYTTDGTEPTTASASAVGTKSLAITANTTLKAFVKNVSNVSSAVKTEVYSFSSAPDLSISPAGGSFTTGNTVNVVLTANVNTSTIYYTTDGTEPTTASASAVGTKSLAITANTTLKAFVKNVSNVSSAVKAEIYSFSSAPDVSISPTGGSFTTGNTVNVVLTANVNTSTIYYTTDGTEPTTASASAVGTKSLVITANTILKAFAKNVSNVSSVVKTEVYEFISLNTLTVYFKPPTSWGVIPKVQYWNAVPEGSVVSSVWPGETMVAGLNGFYKYTIIGPTSVNLIFSNGLTGVNNQTAELLDKTDGYSFSWEETLGIVENESVKSSVVIYPNPVSHIFYISSDSPSVFYQILGIQGNVLLEGIPNNGTIDVSGLKVGVYVIKVKFENGKQCYKKFIKE